MQVAQIKPSDPKDIQYLTYLRDIAIADADGLIEAQRNYGNSWKSRGGIGAFMMMARKFDRLEIRLGKVPVLSEDAGLSFSQSEELLSGDRFDIFQHLIADDRAEGVIDDIRDLRRYLLLVEAEARSMNVPSASTIHRDHVVAPPVEVYKRGGPLDKGERS